MIVIMLMIVIMIMLMIVIMSDVTVKNSGYQNSFVPAHSSNF